LIDQSQVVEHKRARVIQQDETAGYAGTAAPQIPNRQNHAGYGKRSDDGHVAWLDLEVEVVVSASQRCDKLGKFCAHFSESQGGGTSTSCRQMRFSESSASGYGCALGLGVAAGSPSAESGAEKAPWMASAFGLGHHRIRPSSAPARRDLIRLGSSRVLVRA